MSELLDYFLYFCQDVEYILRTFENFRTFAVRKVQYVMYYYIVYPISVLYLVKKNNVHNYQLFISMYSKIFFMQFVTILHVFCPIIFFSEIVKQQTKANFIVKFFYSFNSYYFFCRLLLTWKILTFHLGYLSEKKYQK